MLLQDIFDAQNRLLNDMVSTADFVIAAKRDPQLKTIIREKARGPSEESGLPEENIGQFLDRLLLEAPNFLSWEHVCEYLTTRGRPKSEEAPKEDSEDEGNKPTGKKRARKETELESRKHASEEKPEEFDSYYQLGELDERFRRNREIARNGDFPRTNSLNAFEQGIL
jgi:hypothetical protein